MNNMDVQILSRKLIRPSSADHPKTMTFSLLDQIGPPQFYVSCLFYYLPSNGGDQGRDGGGNNVNNSARTNERLQESLSETLTLFYPFAGRHSKENLFVDCNDEGAEYLEAQVGNCSLAQLLKDGLLESELRRHLFALVLPSEYKQNTPVLKVQCNIFECGGLAVGVTLWRKIADAFTFFTFINSWATACRIGIEHVPSPNFELATIFPPGDLSSLKTIVPRKSEGNIVEKKFVFDGAVISNLKAAASALGQLKHQPSRVEVVTAFLWEILIKVSQARHGKLRSSFLAFSINMRGKTMAALPENCCGNFVIVAAAKHIPEDGEEETVKLEPLVSKLHEGIRRRIADCAEVLNGDDLLTLTNRSFQEMGEALKDEESDFFVIVSWCRFPMYEADFGWGKPAWASYVSTPAQRILLSDTVDGDGIEAWIGVDENSLQLFEQDPDIIAFTTN
ncbi:hypothetical protein Tsubulata_016184 [Turnera subulata]|uniref:Uncharacterized protein n=1 Tax=Turnera subulata TaxID=218843 RepID=A0A9Q0GFC8_9ROSI|nr:hypothetical protein Tsubulata_016184 [Turnera subulata]